MGGECGEIMMASPAVTNALPHPPPRLPTRGGDGTDYAGPLPSSPKQGKRRSLLFFFFFSFFFRRRRPLYHWPPTCSISFAPGVSPRLRPCARRAPVRIRGQSASRLATVLVPPWLGPRAALTRSDDRRRRSPLVKIIAVQGVVCPTRQARLVEDGTWESQPPRVGPRWTAIRPFDPARIRICEGPRRLT